MRDEPLPPAIGIDIGATSSRAGLVSASGEILDTITQATKPYASCGEFVDDLSDVLASLWNRAGLAQEKPGGIGLAVPGTLNRQRTHVVRSAALPWIEGAAIAEAAGARLGSPVSLWTDAEAATWGEHLARSPRVDRFVHLRLGTGIACGAVIDGQLLRIDVDRRTHLETLVIDRGSDAPVCACGLRGCLEGVASGAALLDRTDRLELGRDLESLERAAGRRVERALQLIEQTAQAVGVALQNLTRTFRPDVIVIGGGVVSHCPAIGRAMMQVAGQSVSTAPIEWARRGDDAGMIGAARPAGKPAADTT